MNRDLLRKKIEEFVVDSEKEPNRFKKDFEERQDLVNYYRHFTKETIFKMTKDDIYEYLSKLWAMQLWGNKHYVVDKIIADNGLDNFTQNLAQLLWGEGDIAERWNSFRSKIKGMGPAMVSEILCKTHPDEFML